MIDPMTAGAAVTALKEGLTLLRDALGLAKDVKEALPAGDKKKTVEKGLEQAERQIAIAEAQMASALGFHLCQCTFPPQIMLSKGYQPYEEVFVCGKCGKRWPPPEYPRENREPEF